MVLVILQILYTKNTYFVTSFKHNMTSTLGTDMQIFPWFKMEQKGSLCMISHYNIRLAV